MPAGIGGAAPLPDALGPDLWELGGGSGCAPSPRLPWSVGQARVPPQEDEPAALSAAERVAE